MEPRSDFVQHPDMEPPLLHRRQSVDEKRALRYAFLAIAGWSTVATAFKLGLTALAPAQLLFAGSLVSAILFAATATVQRAWWIDRVSLGQAAALGLLNPVLYYLVLFEAYARLPAQVAQPLNYTWTIVLALLAVPVLGQPLSRRTVAGVLISYAGVLVLITRGHLDGWRSYDLAGTALALASTVLWAGYWLAAVRIAAPPVTMMAWSFLMATPVLATVCWLGPGWPPLDRHTLIYGAWVGLLEMGLTFLLWQRALRLTGQAARLGQLVLLTPFLSLMFIASVLGEAIHPSSVVGLMIIVAGIWMSRRG
jgi:drug/metabolite transporter (DMT)-like permease